MAKATTNNAHNKLVKAFPVEYIKQGLNGTRAYKAIKDRQGEPVTLGSAGVASTRLLKDVNVQKSIMDLLPSDEVESGVLREAFKARRAKDISWKDLRGYTELSLRLKGYLDNDKKSSVQVAVIIER